MLIQPQRVRLYSARDIDNLPQLRRLPAADRAAMKVVAAVLPFRVNSYVVEELIDWDNLPNDPIFQLTFPQRAMLEPEQYERVDRSLHSSDPEQLRQVVRQIRFALNPHPDGQMTWNVPEMDGRRVPGIQHKYPETCLIFPSAGQTCHAYCTYCFRWPQFVGMPELTFATDEADRFAAYIRHHTEITDVLLTGGDPMIMHARRLAQYLEPLLGPDYEHVQTIRIGTKSLSYWPYRFVTDTDADDLLRLFEHVSQSGKHLTLMAHVTHWRELLPPIVRTAICRLRGVGVLIRTQAPLMRHVNDSPADWELMWRDQVRLGCIPYYMFVARDTGAQSYFSVPLYKAHATFQRAYSRVSGLGRSVRGPIMSTEPGKVLLTGVADVQGEPVFVLTFLQARNPDWCNRPFFARFDADATWLDQLRPAFGVSQFFYEAELRRRWPTIAARI